MKQKMKEHPGREVRGFRFRLYTTEEQDLVLRDLTEKMKVCWNWLCYRARDVANAREAYAERYHGVIRPTRPHEEAASEVWYSYRVALGMWRHEIRRVCTNVDAVSYRSLADWRKHFGGKQDYQIFKPATGVSLPAHLLDALCKDYQAALAATKRGQAPPRPKRQHDHVTLRVRSGNCMKLRAVGPRPKAPGRSQGRADWLNCEVHLPTVGWIAGHIGNGQMHLLEPSEYWVQGVSIVEETDGWYASIRQWVVPRPKREGPSPGTRWRGYGLPASTCSPTSRGDVFGIDTGLVHLATVVGATDILQSGNSRTRELLERVAGRQAQELPVGKLLTQASRRVRHLLRGVEAWIREAEPSALAIEDGDRQDPSDAGPANSIALYISQDGRGRRRREGGYTPSAGWLLARLADLTREVSRDGTSQTCSHCGIRDKSCLDSETREFRCRHCGLTVDRDLGAARNIRAKLLESQDPPADGL